MPKLTENELLNLLDNTESDLVERKQSFRNEEIRKKARQAVCAFANDLPNHKKPGVLFIGAKDNGSPSGEKIDDKLLQSLSDMARDGNILPLPTITVEKRTLKGAQMAIVYVEPSDSPPVKYDGRIWIRIGPRRAIASTQEERMLNEKRRYKDIPFDIRPFSSASLSALSRTIFENEYLPSVFAADVLEENNRSYEERLASVKMIVSPEDTTPTFLGLIFIGTSTQDFIPAASIQFLRINGNKLTDEIIDEQHIGGTLPEMLRRAEDKLTAHNYTQYDITSGATHKITRMYPPVALRQLLYNSVLHRNYQGTHAPVHLYWYNNRIEISNPGGPYGSVNKINFGNPGIVDYRNPNIAEAMKNYDYVQRFGRGIALARKTLQESGHPELEFQVERDGIACIIRGKQ